MLAGKDLIADIEACSVQEGQAGIWWMGQQSYIVKLGSSILYLDPFLSPHPKRQIPPLLKPEGIHHATLILGSHDHRDHIDRPSWPALAKASPQARFVTPKFLLPKLAQDLDLSLSRFIGLDDGLSIEKNGIKVTGVASAHEFLDRDPRTGSYPYLGYVIEGNGVTLYHAGDTCLYEGIQAKLRRWKLDAAFLPINGRDARRLASGCIGNLTYQEAADLAGAISPGLTIPGHYDMFAANSENPRLFADYMRIKYPHLKVGLCEHGQRVLIGG